MENNFDVLCVFLFFGVSNYEKWICVLSGLISGFDVDFVYWVGKNDENLVKYRCFVGRIKEN